MKPLDALPTRVLEKIQFEPNTGCWLWIGGLSTNGLYGRAWDASKWQMVPAHVLVYEALVGPVGKPTLDHKVTCVKRCCNPEHVIPATHYEQMKYKREQTHCQRGHEFTPDNTIIDGGWRRCRTCRDIRSRKYYLTTGGLGRTRIRNPRNSLRQNILESS